MQPDSSTRIPLRSRSGEVRAYAVVDESDAGWLNAWRWYLHHANGREYAARSCRVNGQRFCILMHRAVLGLLDQPSSEVDHADGDGLNNRRRNLQAVSHSGNMENQRKPRRANATSQYRGVRRGMGERRWQARGKLGGKDINLGYFDTEMQAAEVAALWRAENLPNSPEGRARGAGADRL